MTLGRILEVVPTWPGATEPDWVLLLVLCVGIPLAVGAVVSLLYWMPTLRKQATADQQGVSTALDTEHRQGTESGSARRALEQGDRHS